METHVSALSHLHNYLARENEVARQIEATSLEYLIRRLVCNSQEGGRVFIAGNGGSAATAEHFAVDLGVGSHIRSAKNVINAISLSSNSAVLTALGNDVSIDSIFSKQLEVMNPDIRDLVFVISASGNSPNIVQLLEVARNLKVTTCALTGFDGGRARELVDISIHVRTLVGEYGIVEDIHLAICHAITEILRK